MSDIDYRHNLDNVLNYSTEQFDKTVLFIASGALGISFAFIEKLIPNLQGATKSHLLIQSWCVFAVVIFISLVAHFISMCAIRWAIAHEHDPNFDKGFHKWNYTIRSINVLMILGLLFGILWLIRFVNSNI